MRNSIFYMAAIAGVLFLASCGTKSATAGDAIAIANASHNAASYKLNLAKSVITWTGTKFVGVGEHKGTIGLKEGSISVENNNIVAGNFLIDMNNIQSLDLPDEEQKAMLIGHFKSDDFFNVEKYPTAKFEISKVEPKAEGVNTHLITGNLTLRDVTKAISFPAKVDVNEVGLVAKGAVTINRLDWGINYDKDKMSLSEAAQQSAKNGIVSKEIQLDIHIQAAQ